MTARFIVGDALERVGPLVLGPPEKPQPKEKGKAQQ